MKASRFAVIVGIFLLALALNTRATTYYADATLGNNSYDGLSSVVSGGDGPKFNIISAIVASSSGDAIVAATGSYDEYLWDTGAKSLTLNPQGDVTIAAVDAFQVDSIGDGIADGWRLEFFGSATTTNSSSCATCDPDGDTYNNLQEYTLFTDPTNSASYPSPILPFTNTFSRSNPPRIIMPNNNYTGFFTAGQTNNIYTTDGSPLTVWKITGRTFSNIYNGGATNISLVCTQGWYCVQSGDDRSQFGVLRPGFSRGSNSVMDTFGAPVLEDYDIPSPVYTAYTNVLSAYSRDEYPWYELEPNASNFYWTVVDSNNVFDAANGQRVIGDCWIRPGWQTNDADFIPEWQYAVSNLFDHCGTNLYAFLIWNEPYGSTFTNFSAIQYATNNLGIYSTNLVSGGILGNAWGISDPAYSPWWDTNGWYVTGADTNSWEAFYFELVKVAAAAKAATHSQVQLIAGVTSGCSPYRDSFYYWKSHGLTNYVQGVACHMNDNEQFSDFTTNSSYNISALDEMRFFATNFPSLSIWEDEAHLIGDSALTGQAYTNSSEQKAGALDTLDWWVGYNRGVKNRMIYAVFGAYVNNYLMWFNPFDMVATTNCCLFDSDIGVNGWEPGRGIKLKDTAYLTIEDMLAGATGLCMTNDTSSVLVAWSKNGHATLCFWTAENSPTVNTLLSSATDVFGNPVGAIVTEMPIFWTTNAASTVALSNAWNNIRGP